MTLNCSRLNRLGMGWVWGECDREIGEGRGGERLGENVSVIASENEGGSGVAVEPQPEDRIKLPTN